MNKTSINQSIHKTEVLKQGGFFLKHGSPCTKIGQLTKGVLRGFVYDNEGNAITTHFYQEGAMIIGSYIPNVNTTKTIQALEESEISVTNYSNVMSLVNKNQEITEIINLEFQNLNKQLQSKDTL